MLAFIMALLMHMSYDAQGKTLEEHFILKLQHAHGRREIDKIQDEFDHLKVMRLACRLQIKAQQVPLSCYETLHQETKWNLHTPAQVRRLQSRLDERCRKAAARLHVPDESDVSMLSKACSADLRQAQRIVQYKKRDPAWSEN